MRITVRYNGQKVGILEEISGSTKFEYDAEFINSGIELSPLHLPLARGVHTHPHIEFSGLHGLFYDSLPDAFGSMVLEKRFQDKGLGIPTPLMKLAYIGDRGIGALTYEPVISDKDEVAVIAIEEAVEEARKFREGIPKGKIMKAFFTSPGGLGGRHPKALCGLKPGSDEITICEPALLPEDFIPHIIKIDPELGAPVLTLEKIYLEMARAAGIETTDSQLIQQDGLTHLVLKRFDIEGSNRLHQVTLCGVAHMSFFDIEHSYADLFNVVDELTRKQPEQIDMFKRMVFNIMTHNHDDHPKNFSFLMKGNNDYELSPAYDLLWSESEYGHLMLVGEKRENITYSDIADMLDDYLIDRKVVDRVITEVMEGVSRFWDLAKHYKLDATSTRMVEEHLTKSLSSLKPTGGNS